MTYCGNYCLEMSIFKAPPETKHLHTTVHQHYTLIYNQLEFVGLMTTYPLANVICNLIIL